MFDFSCFAPLPALADVIETIGDLDLPDAVHARALTINILPGVCPTLSLHYRAVPVSNQSSHSTQCHQQMTGVRTRAVTLQPTGPVGSVFVRFKPEASHRFPASDMERLTDATIGLADLVGPAAAAALEETLKKAIGPIQRVGRVQSFLLQHLGTDTPDQLVRRAVMQLRARPGSSVSELAADLEISQRQLLRRFRLFTGTPVKKFAQIARLSHAIRARRAGKSWTESAHEAGFADLSHLGHAFRRMTGYAPTALFQSAAAPAHRRLNALLATSGFFDTLII